MITLVPHRANPAWQKPGPADNSAVARAAYSLRSRMSRWAQARLPWLNLLGARITVRDLFSSPGDTLLAAIVCRHLKERWPRLRINCITSNPDLLIHDPHLSELNGPPGLLLFDFWYLDIQSRKDKVTNILAPTLNALGIRKIDCHSRVYLTADERSAARELLKDLRRPFIAFNSLSAQPAKNWPLANWQILVPELARRGSLVQVGDKREPVFPAARRVAGELSKRESMAVLAECDIHLGPDSFLMHAANGLDVPSVIILGGSRTPANLSYSANINLYTDLPCSGCWLSGLPGAECPYELKCLTAIAPKTVLDAADALLARPATGAQS